MNLYQDQTLHFLINLTMPAVRFLLFFLFMVDSGFGFDSLFTGEGRNFITHKRLSKPLTGDGGRIYACSDKILFAFENNGSIVWSLPLGFKCNMSNAPVACGRENIFLIGENRVLKINLRKIGTREPAVEVFFGPGPDQTGGDEIVGLAVSTFSSSMFINVKNRGLFAYKIRGQLLWSIGPVLDQYGYKQGCKGGVSDCYFASVPVIDQCEASVYVSNTEGELYSLTPRSAHFKWIRDLSSYDKVYTVTPGNDGRVYVTVPLKSIILALDVSSGNVLWQKSIGPLSSAESSPVVDNNGWVTIGSTDGYLYSLSPTGTLKKFLKASVLDSVIQFSPLLDCSGYGVYYCLTIMEGKFIHINDEYTYVTALKPKGSVFTLMVPATGKIYWSETHNGPLVSSFSKSDLQYFVVDEGMLLAFMASSNTGNLLPCRSKGLQLAPSCSRGTHKHHSFYTGSKKDMILFLLIESLLVVVLVILVWFCCIFWRKKKLQDQDLGRFLEKRRSLQLEKKSFDRTISELERTAAGETAANETMEKLGELVRKRQGIERKLSTTYSLGRDEAGSKAKALLPLHGRTRSYSFLRGKTENITLFHTLSNTSSEQSISSSSEREISSDSDEREEAVTSAKAKGKAKVTIESESESASEGEQLLGRKFYQRSPSEPGPSSKGYISSLSVEQKSGKEKLQNDGLVVESMTNSSRRNNLVKRTLSSI